MSDTTPTVKVKADNEQGFYLLNESDFDAAVHELFDKPKKSKKSDVAENAAE